MNDALIKDFISQLSSLTNRIWQIGDLLEASQLHEWAREQRKVAEGLGVLIAKLNGGLGDIGLADEKPTLDARLECLERMFIEHKHEKYEQRLNTNEARLREIEKDLKLTVDALLAVSPLIDKHEATLHQMNAELTIDNPNNYGYRLSKLEQDFETFRQAFVQSLEADKKYLKYQAGFKEL